MKKKEGDIPPRRDVFKIRVRNSNKIVYTDTNEKRK